ncbi:MAG TPA: hypothetical protein VK973_09825, partial [Arenicellales bacterium]|nr:hypothetical protein [Arenicellales bacterium]
MLEKLNSFREADSVMVHESVAGFSYSDGSDVELYLKNVLETAEDLGSCSVELEAAIHDWPTEYHLSSQRANLVRGLSLPSR